MEELDQMGGIFDGEVEGLVALAAQNVGVEVHLTHPKVAGLSFLQLHPVERTAQGSWTVQLGDVYATSARELGLIFHVEDVRELGKVELGHVRVEADVVQGAGIEHRTTTLPVVANLDGEDRIEPTVERNFIRFAAARAREEAVRLADNGDFGPAARKLRDAAAELAHLPATPPVVDEMEDLRVEADRLEARLCESLDRKYHSARAMAARDLNADYLRRVSWRRRRSPPAGTRSSPG